MSEVNRAVSKIFPLSLLTLTVRKEALFAVLSCIEKCIYESMDKTPRIETPTLICKGLSQGLSVNIFLSPCQTRFTILDKLKV